MAQEVSVSVSYARKDRVRVEQLLALVVERCAALAKWKITFFWDRQVPVGAQFQPYLVDKFNSAHYTIHMLSAAFFASEFIKTFEVPGFTGPGATRKTIPVGLGRVPLTDVNFDLLGFPQLNVFRLNDKKFYSELRSAADRELFAEELVQAIIRRFGKDYPGV